MPQIHFAITLHLPHIKFQSPMLWHFSKPKNALNSNVSVHVLPHVVEKVLHKHCFTKYWGNGHKEWEYINKTGSKSIKNTL